MGVSVPLSTAEDEHVSTEEDFDRHRESEWGQTESARRWLEHCVDTMELVLLAASKSGSEKIRYRLPGWRFP